MSFLKENRMAGETPTYTYVTYTKNLGMQRKLNQNKINEYVCEVTLGHLTQITCIRADELEKYCPPPPLPTHFHINRTNRQN